MMAERRIEQTADGSHTIFIPELGEHYHSIHGSINESLHVFIENGLKRVRASKIRILEVGFGTGLNALLTCLNSQSSESQIYYESWEKYPLKPEEYQILNFADYLGGNHRLLLQLHEAPWEVPSQITDHFTLIKRAGDIRNFNSDHLFDLVYFDAFGPAIQPDLWSRAVFSSIAQTLEDEAILVTYSVKGQIRRNLKEAGFRATKVPGPKGKREITVAYYG